VTVSVVANTHLFTTADGSMLWCGGHTPVDEEGSYLRIEEHRISDAIRHIFLRSIPAMSYQFLRVGLTTLSLSLNGALGHR
jgi:hypothetical protein